jgi:putative SOS response-associated peptidase YedK
MFRDAFKRGKQPYYITSTNGPILTIAGLWTEWRDRVNKETLTTCTMIITEANSLIGAIHDRMPVLLDQEGTAAWLSELLKPAPGDALRMWPVSRRVSKPGNDDDPTLIDPVAVLPAAEGGGAVQLN